MLIIACVGLCPMLAFSQKFCDALMYVRTLRGSAQISNNETSLKVSDVSPAKEFVIECNENEFVSFALSTGAVIFLEGKTKVKILEASQEKFRLQKPIIKQERAISKVVLELEYGKLSMARPTPRPTSIFKVETRFGSILATGENLFVELNKTLKFCACDFAVNYTPKGSENVDYIGMGYALNVFEEDGKIKNRREQITNEYGEILKSKFARLSDAKQTTAFEFDAEGKAVKAFRIVPKHFWARENKRPIQ